jgi:CubicO group peptidase (beta-lactamase class C family)
VNGHIIARHDNRHDDYQRQWDELVPQGYRPICLSVYGDRSNPLYASVWAKRPGPAFAGVHGTDAAGFQAFFDKWAAQGFSPTILAATGPANNPVYAAVMEKSAHGVSLTRHALVSGSEDDPATIQHWLREAQRRGWIPRWLSVFGGPGDRRYAVVLDPNPEGVLWNVDGLWGEDAGGYQQRFEAQASQWAWPSLVTVTPDGRGFASVFRDGDMGAWVARHNMGSADYQREVEAWWPKGYFPLYVQAGGSGADARFACLFVQGEKPAQRRFTTTGADVPALRAVDQKVEAFMRSTGTRAVGVAVVRGSRLVHARGYSWAEAGYPLTQPTTTFRVASCTKPLTAIAVHVLIQKGALKLSDRMVDLLDVPTGPGSGVDPRLREITVHHLLTHTAGWDRAKKPDLPRIEDVARFAGQTRLPVTIDAMARYRATLPLEFRPGERMAYGNLAYLYLGLIVERVADRPYASFARTEIFGKLGLARPHLARSALAAQRPGSARQHDNGTDSPDLRVTWSATTGPVDGPRPLVPLAYGGEDLDLFKAFGGWCMAPCDYAKVLASLDRGGPVLTPASRDTMWAIPWFLPASRYVNGWDSFEAGGGVRGFQHGGGMPGVVSRILYRTDGWGFAVFGNGPGGVPDIYPELAAMAPSAWPAHDLFPQVGIPAF